MHALNLHLKRSKQFIILNVLIMLGSVGLIYYCSLKFEYKLLLVLFSLSYGGWILFWHAFNNPVKQLIFHDNDWWIRSSRETQVIQVLGETTLTRWMTVLRYKKPETRIKQTCLIFSDSVEKDQYRRLLVTLRSGK
jgi:hypothetical protein